MKELKKIALNKLKNQHFDTLAVGVIDFSKNSFESFEVHNQKDLDTGLDFYFDLASLTKPLTLASTYQLHKEIFDENTLRLLNHRAGLISGGRISPKGWRDYIKSFSVSTSDQDTTYSDYSALRTMLEVEEKAKKPLYDLCSSFWDKELVSWLDLPWDCFSPVTGSRHDFPICGEVHDDNAYYLEDKVSHAGLFSTINGLCQSLINLNTDDDLFIHMNETFKMFPNQRFKGGWDTVTDLENTLAGKGCGPKTFGHLGFTGTSIWIDLEKKRGAVILTNATQNFWYDRPGLGDLRKTLGSYIWSM